MDRLLLRLFRFLNRHLDPDEGWGALLAALAALFVLAAAVEEARWVGDAPGPYVPALLSVLFGLVLAKRLRRKWAALAWAAGGGLLFSVLTAARAWPPLSLIIANLRLAWASLRTTETAIEVVPLGVWLVERLSWWGGSMGGWAQATLAGRSAPAAAPVTFAILLVIWAVGVWAGWITFRRHRALLALTPAGVALATNVFFAARGLSWLLFFVAAMLLLALMLRHYTLRRRWEQDGIDYAPELQIEFYTFGLAVVLVAVSLMSVMPNVRVRFITRAFWRVFDAPVTDLQNRTQAIFPDLDRPPRSLVGGGAVAGGLPRAHLLGGNPELAEREILRVRTSDANAADPAVWSNYRWRGLTFAGYNGRGWDAPDAVETVRFDPGEMWTTETPAGRRPLRQVFEFSAEEPFWLYAAGDPVAADRPARAHLRAPGDAIGLDVRARNYIAISQTPAIEPEALAAAPLDHSPAIATTYLALPDSVPDRVRSLARQITADADNPFDQAKAIEAYLRQFPYNLDIPEPPPGVVDVADYFLFDLQQGYCDYYATTLIVMARSLGLPARLAVGYAPGRYDPDSGQFIVVEADAHSWPEIHFADYGWIPFEPTAAQPIFTHPAAPVEADPDQPPELDLAAELSALRWRAWLVNGVLRLGLPLLAGLILLVGFRLGLREWRLRRQAADAWQLAYLRLENWGRKLGVPPADWYTPCEYAARWRRFLRQSPPTAAAVTELSRGLEQRQYAPAPARPAEADAARLWRTLRRELRGQFWRQRLARWLRRR